MLALRSYTGWPVYMTLLAHLAFKLHLLKLSEDDAPNLLELIHKRRKHSSTIFCSQFREEGWYNKLGGKDSPLSDAIMDRISYDSYKIVIESINPDKDISMREVYGLDPKLAQ